MQKKERYERFVEYQLTHHPDVETELNYSSPFQLLIAVSLSAQCTDKRVNIVTPAIFKDFPTPATLAATSFDELFPYIKSISYPNNKTKHLIGMAKVLLNEFNNIVPADINELQTMPGVGRKTANVIASVIYNLPTMAVDTHVFRVANRMGLTTNAKTPLESEKQLVKHIPTDLISTAHHWLILHGRYVCLARKPKCEICEMKDFCKYYEKTYLKIPPSK